MGRTTKIGLAAFVSMAVLAIAIWHLGTARIERSEAVFEPRPAQDDTELQAEIEASGTADEAPKDALEGQIETMLDHMFGTVEEARRRFERNPTDKDAVLRLLMHYTDPSGGFSAKQRDAFLTKAVRANPKDRDLLLNLAAVYQTEERLEEGRKFFESLGRGKDYSPEVDSILADFYVGLNDWDAAVAATLRAAERSADPLHEVRAAYYLIDEGRLSEAKRCLERAEAELAAAARAARDIDTRLDASLRDAKTDEDLERVWKEKIGSAQEDSLRYGSDLVKLGTEFQILRARVRIAILEEKAARAAELLAELEARIDSLEKDPSFDVPASFVEREREKNLWLRRHFAH